MGNSSKMRYEKEQLLGRKVHYMTQNFTKKIFGIAIFTFKL